MYGTMVDTEECKRWIYSCVTTLTHTKEWQLQQNGEYRQYLSSMLWPLPPSLQKPIILLETQLRTSSTMNCLQLTGLKPSSSVYVMHAVSVLQKYEMTYTNLYDAASKLRDGFHGMQAVFIHSVQQGSGEAAAAFPLPLAAFCLGGTELRFFPPLPGDNVSDRASLGSSSSCFSISAPSFSATPSNSCCNLSL